jgi:hypothetical protein
MKKFKDTNYLHQNGELFKKNETPLKKDKDRYRIRHNGKKMSVLLSEVQLIADSNFKTLDGYFLNKSAKQKKVFLPKDIHEKLEQKHLLSDAVVKFLYKIFTSENYSTIYLPSRFMGCKPIEVSKKYLEKIGMKKKKGNTKSELEKLKELDIITPIPYEVIYDNKRIERNFLRSSNHCNRYILNYESDELIPCSYSVSKKQIFACNNNDQKRKDCYNKLFEIINKEGLVAEFENDILELENEKKPDFLVEIAILKQLIDEIQTNDCFYYRNTTNNREEKILNRIENKKRGLRNKYTNIGQFGTIDITCSQLRFLYIFLSNPSSVLFNDMNNYYKEQLEMNSENLNSEISKLKNDLSQPDYWNCMSSRHNIQDKEEIKQDMMYFLANSNYEKYKTKYFGIEYPKISQFLCAINTLNKEYNVFENEFIIEMQRSESMFVLDIVSNVLIRLKVDVFALHDQWFFKKKNSCLVKKVIDKFTTKYFEGLTDNYK